MWLEVKIVISGIGIIMLFLVLSQIIMLNMFLGMLIIMAIGMTVFSDILIGWRITSTHAKYMIDSPPPGQQVIPIFTLTGLLDFVWATKKPYGKREFVYNGQEASVIDRGDYPIHLLNGGHGCVAHESCDENINMKEAKYAQELTQDLNTDNLKEIYHLVKEEEKNEQ